MRVINRSLVPGALKNLQRKYKFKRTVTNLRTGFKRELIYTFIEFGFSHVTATLDKIVALFNSIRRKKGKERRNKILYPVDPTMACKETIQVCTNPT